MAAQDNGIQLMDPDQLSVELIEAQYALKDTKGKSNAKSVLILVSGIELAGKGEAVKQLREWVDPRYLRVKADAPQTFNHKQAFWLTLCALYSCRRANHGDVRQLVQ